MPYGTVCEDTDVALSSLLASGPDIAGELLFGGLEDCGAAEVLLDFDDGEAELDVYAATVTDLGFQFDIKIVIGESKAPSEQ
ncbi:hypothetical protein GCM10027161_21040 [Microbispora hainanensis]